MARKCSVKGSNKIMLNEPTMVAAVQLYLDSKFRDGLSPIVKSVTAKVTNGYGATTFAVTIEERVSTPIGDLGVPCETIS